MRIKALLLLVVILTGCSTPVANSPRWLKSIGTDLHAGAIERLELDDLSMEWTTSKKGAGWLSLVEPGTNVIAWSSPGPLPIEKDGRSIYIKDGDIFTVVHKSGREFEIRVITQTEYFIKIMYRELKGYSPKIVESPNKYSEGIAYIKSWSPSPLNEKYYKLWVDLFIKANDLEDDDMINHFKLIDIRWSKTWFGSDLTVLYSLKQDWFLSQKEASGIPIRINRDNHAFPFLANRKDVNLTKDDLFNNIADLHIKSDKVMNFIKTSSRQPLKFSSEEEALFNLSEALQVESLDGNHVNHETINGQPILSTSVTISRKDNKCRFGSINLLSGKIDIRNSPCAVY